MSIPQKFFSRLLLATLAATALPCHGTQYVQPGDNGSIVWTISNDPASNGPMTGVAVTTASAPSYFLRQGSSQLGPVTIYPGGQYTFQFDYQIDAGAPDGSFDVVLQSTQTTQYVSNRSQQASIGFIIGRDQFLVEGRV